MSATTTDVAAALFAEDEGRPAPEPTELQPSRPWPPDGAAAVIEGVVLGVAKTAGSKWSGVVTRFNPDTGKREPVRRPGGKGFMTFTKDSSGAKGDSWRSDVRDAVVAVFGPDRDLLDAPLVLELVTYRVRPKSHFGSGRNAGVLKPSAPAYPTSSSGESGGDVSKLARAFEDALNKLVWADDSRIVDLRSAKDWTSGRPRAEYRLWALSPTRG